MRVAHNEALCVHERIEQRHMRWHHQGADRSRTPSQRQLTAAPRPLREQRSPSPCTEASDVTGGHPAFWDLFAAPATGGLPRISRKTVSDLLFSRWALEDLNL